MKAPRLVLAFVLVFAVAALAFAQSSPKAKKPAGGQSKAGGAGMAANPADEKALRALVTQYEQAFNAGDAAKAAAVYADTAVFVDEMGSVHEGRAAIEKDLSGDSGGQRPKLSLTVDAVRLIKPDVALMRGNSTVQGGDVPAGQGAGHWAVVAMKVGGQWKVVAAQAAVNPPAQGRGR